MIITANNYCCNDNNSIVFYLRADITTQLPTEI